MNLQDLIYSFHWLAVFQELLRWSKTTKRLEFAAEWMTQATTVEIRCWNLTWSALIQAEFSVPKWILAFMTPPTHPPTHTTCTLVTQLLNPVRPKWLRPSQHLNLTAAHSDRLCLCCTHHMVVVSLSPRTHMRGNLSEVVGAYGRERRAAPRKSNHWRSTCRWADILSR